MKKTLLASLGLTLMLSTTASVALAEEANSIPVAKESTLASALEYNEQEPNDWFEQANYYFIGDAVIGTLGKEGCPESGKPLTYLNLKLLKLKKFILQFRETDILIPGWK